MNIIPRQFVIKLRNIICVITLIQGGNYSREETIQGRKLFKWRSYRLKKGLDRGEGHKMLQNLHQLFDWQYIGQIIGGDFAKFCGFLRIYEL